MQLLEIKPDDLVLLDDLTDRYPIRVDLVYAKPAHPQNMFHEAIYREDAGMWGHRDFVPIILRAAQQCHREHGLMFELKDCLRTTEAQQKICDSAIVRAHPQWLEEPRLFSTPGKGGHPRGMAIDIILIDANGDKIDMGTEFDYLTEDKSNNPAARDYRDFGRGDAYNQMVLKNRQILEQSMMQAAASWGRDILPLPEEWWDFRFPNAFTGQYIPVSDATLPPHMRMTHI
jgi:D-alanyl-D-alanine dipeptidase